MSIARDIIQHAFSQYPGVCDDPFAESNEDKTVAGEGVPVKESIPGALHGRVDLLSAQLAELYAAGKDAGYIPVNNVPDEWYDKDGHLVGPSGSKLANGNALWGIKDDEMIVVIGTRFGNVILQQHGVNPDAKTYYTLPQGLADLLAMDVVGDVEEDGLGKLLGTPSIKNVGVRLKVVSTTNGKKQ